MCFFSPLSLYLSLKYQWLEGFSSEPSKLKLHLFPSVMSLLLVLPVLSHVMTASKSVSLVCMWSPCKTCVSSGQLNTSTCVCKYQVLGMRMRQSTTQVAQESPSHHGLEVPGSSRVPGTKKLTPSRCQGCHGLGWQQHSPRWEANSAPNSAACGRRGFAGEGHVTL